MYCCDCHSKFDEPKKYYERGEAWGAPFEQAFECCPYCDSDDIVDEDDYLNCDCCGELCLSNYIKTSDDKCYCENCFEYVMND